MKLLFLTSLFVILLITNGLTQTEKGNLLIGGNVNFNTMGGPGSTRGTSFIINPSLGYFIKKNLAVGFDLSYSYRNFIYNSSPQSTYHRIDNDWEVYPFIRYYKFLNDKLALYGQVGIGMNYTRTHYKNSTFSPENQIRAGITLKPGLVYFLNKKFGLELTAGNISYYTIYTDYTNNYKFSSDNFTFGFGLRSLSLGAYFYL